jgi:hypothetical protein
MEGGLVRIPTFERLVGGLGYDNVPLLASIISDSQFLQPFACRCAPFIECVLAALYICCRVSIPANV